jgi:glutamine cyclotransferase
MMMWSNFSALSWREQVTFQWNDDDVEQLFSSIMATTSYISMKWWWCGATFQPYHGENQLHFNEMMMMWSNFSALSWREPVTFQWNDDDVEQLFSSIMARTSYISMKWWCGATFRLYHGENKLHFNEMMMMWSNFSALSWREPVTFQWNDDDVEQRFSPIMARTITFQWNDDDVGLVLDQQA